MLFIVSTPIGNLEDITLRAIRTLKEADYIAAEDTRKTGILLQKHQITKKNPLLSYHSYSSKNKENKIIEILKSGKKVALVSDAGTPGISDPAYSLIQDVIANNITIVPIPGPSSALAALVMSGKPMSQFLYLGFLPVKKGRKTALEQIHQEKISHPNRSIIIFESPHRLLKTLKDLEDLFHNPEESSQEERTIAICREITKIHEEAIRTTIPEAIRIFSQANKKPKGEFVLVI